VRSVIPPRRVPGVSGLADAAGSKSLCRLWFSSGRGSRTDASVCVLKVGKFFSCRLILEHQGSGRLIRGRQLSTAETTILICTPARSGPAFGPLISRTMESPEKTIELLKRGGSQLINEVELKKKLEEGRALRVKFGVDPTSPDLHLGHSVNLFKLRQCRGADHRRFHIDGGRSEWQIDHTSDADPRPGDG
jgi:hypothetical protein